MIHDLTGQIHLLDTKPKPTIILYDLSHTHTIQQPINPVTYSGSVSSTKSISCSSSSTRIFLVVVLPTPSPLE